MHIRLAKLGCGFRLSEQEMMKKLSLSYTLIVVGSLNLGLASNVWAHPGHSEAIALSQTGLEHFLTAPMHAAPLMMIGLLGLSWFWSKVLRRNK